MKFSFTTLAGKLTDIARHFSTTAKTRCTTPLINYFEDDDPACAGSFSVYDWEADRTGAIHHLYPIAGGLAAYMLQTKTKKQITRNSSLITHHS